MDKSISSASSRTLQAAVITGDINQLKQLLHDSNVDVNTQDAKGLTDLRYALDQENFEAVKILTDAGANVNTASKNGRSALHFATEKNDLSLVQHLLSYEADVNIKDNENKTPLHKAVAYKKDSFNRSLAENNLVIVQLLLSFGADVNLKNNKGESPVFNAVSVGNSEVVKFLLDHGANVNAIDNFRLTPLHTAAACNYGNSHQKVAEVLLKAGADVDAQDENGSTAFHILVTRPASVKVIELFLDHKANVNAVNSQGETPLMIAISGSSVEVIFSLLENGAEINAANAIGSMPLHRAAAKNQDKSHMKVVEALLKNGAAVNAQDTDGNTPLHHLVAKSSAKVLQLFLDSGADVTLKNHHEEVPLFEAVRNSNHEVVQLLLDHGSDVNSLETGSGSTPLHEAARCNDGESHLKVARILAKKGANFEATDERGRTPLHYLVSKVKVRMAKFFLQFVPDVNVKDVDGESPLLEAIRAKNLEIAQVLVDHGANVNTVNGKTGSTALHETCNLNLQSPKAKGFLTLLLRHADVGVLDSEGNSILDVVSEKLWRTVLEHLARFQSHDLPLIPRILDAITDNEEYKEYFEKCTSELSMAKGTKSDDCWVTFFDLLEDSERKLKNYAGNKELVMYFNSCDYKQKFPIYGAEVKKNLEDGIHRRGLFDQSEILLSECIPIFNPKHLIVRDVLDSVVTKDLARFAKKRAAE